MKERFVSLTVNVGVFTSRLETRFKESSVDASVEGILLMRNPKSRGSCCLQVNSCLESDA